MKKVCANCHAEISDTAIICPVCGAPAGQGFGNQSPMGGGPENGQEDPTVSSLNRDWNEENGTTVLSSDVLVAGSNPAEKPGSGPQFRGPMNEPQFGGPGSGPQYGGPMNEPQFGGPGSGPQYGGPMNEPQFGGPGSGPQYGGPMNEPQFGGPGSGPQKAAPVNQPKKKKKGLIIGLIIGLVLIAAGTLLFIFVIRPKMIKDKGDKLLSQGKYDEAIAEYEKLSDPDEYIKECKYQKYIGILENGGYEEAKEGFTELGDYKESALKLKECEYQSARDLLGQGKYDEAKLKFQNLADYSDATTMVSECDYQRALAHMGRGDYEEALKWFESLGNYADAQNKKAECEEAIRLNSYKEAQALYDAGQYEEAISAFTALGDYKDSKEKVRMSYYARGDKDMADQKYIDAISAYEKADTYSDASEKRKEAIYQYVLTEVNAGHLGDQKVEDYFKELYDANYKDSRSKYEEAHRWKLEFYAISTSEDDKTSFLTEVSYKERVYFHYRVVSGESGTPTKIGWRGVWANGSKAESKDGDRYEIKSGDTGWLWFSNPDESAKGPLYIEAFDGNGVVIGTATVTLTD